VAGWTGENERWQDDTGRKIKTFLLTSLSFTSISLTTGREGFRKPEQKQGNIYK